MYADVVQRSGHLLLYLQPWDNPWALMRAWRMWEVFNAVDTGALLTIILPAAEEAAFEEALTQHFDEIATMLSRIDTRRAVSYLEADRQMICSAIEASAGGFTAVNAMLQACLRDWLAQTGFKALRRAQKLNGGLLHADTLRLGRGMVNLLKQQGKLADARRLFDEIMDGYASEQPCAVVAAPVEANKEALDLAALLDRTRESSPGDAHRTWSASDGAIALQGVSLEVLRAFCAQHAGQLDDRLSTREVVARIIKPATLGTGRSFAQLLGEACDTHGHPLVGQATIFISHAWDYPFSDLRDAIFSHFEGSADAHLVYLWNGARMQQGLSLDDLDCLLTAGGLPSLSLPRRYLRG
jgi:hypothetical protein